MNTQRPVHNVGGIGKSVEHAQGSLPHTELSLAKQSITTAMGELACVESDTDVTLHITPLLAETLGAISDVETSLCKAAGELHDYHDTVTGSPSEKPHPLLPESAARAEAAVQEATEPTTELHPLADSPSKGRKAYHEEHGITLYNNVNHNILAATAAQRIWRLPDIHSLRSRDSMYSGNDPALCEALTRENPSGGSLFLATGAATELLPSKHFLNRASLEEYGATPDDMDKAHGYTFNYGFGDLSFPWDFSSAAANAITDFFVDEGAITQEQKDAFTLTDWADMIRTGWFSRTIHLLAIASNGAYGTFGSDYAHYGKGELSLCIKQNLGIELPDGVFTLRERTEAYDGNTYITAIPSPLCIRKIRKELKRTGNSIGCPVARNTALIPKESLTPGSHAQQLIDKGILMVIPERSTETHVRVIQENTPIDRSLMLLAKNLSTYDNAYGTPRLTYKSPSPHATIHHESVPPVNALWRPA